MNRWDAFFQLAGTIFKSELNISINVPSVFDSHGSTSSLYVCFLNNWWVLAPPVLSGRTPDTRQVTQNAFHISGAGGGFQPTQSCRSSCGKWSIYVVAAVIFLLHYISLLTEFTQNTLNSSNVNKRIKHWIISSHKLKLWKSCWDVPPLGSHSSCPQASAQRLMGNDPLTSAGLRLCLPPSQGGCSCVHARI